MENRLLIGVVIVVAVIATIFLLRNSRHRFEEKNGIRTTQENYRLFSMLVLATGVLLVFSYLAPSSAMLLNMCIMLASLLGVTGHGRSLWNDLIYCSVFAAIPSSIVCLMHFGA